MPDSIIIKYKERGMCHLSLGGMREIELEIERGRERREKKQKMSHIATAYRDGGVCVSSV